MKHCNVLMLELNMSQTDSCMKAQTHAVKGKLFLAQRKQEVQCQTFLESRN